MLHSNHQRTKPVHMFNQKEKVACIQYNSFFMTPHVSLLCHTFVENRTGLDGL